MENGSVQMGHSRVSVSRSNFRFSFPISEGPAELGGCAMAALEAGARTETTKLTLCIQTSV